MKIKIDYTEDDGLIIKIDNDYYSVVREYESENLFIFPVCREHESEYLSIFPGPIEQNFICFEDAKHVVLLNHLLKHSKLL